MYREHCYWFTSRPSSLSSWTIVDALDKCREDGGYLAPLIDYQNYQFIKDDVLRTIKKYSSLAWYPFDDEFPSNWNNEPSFVTLLLPSSSRDIPLITPEPKICEPDISNVNINSTTVEELKRVLFIDPEQTNAYKLTKISVYEDRPVAKAIGGVGVAILISVILFIVLLDCQRLEQCITKRRQMHLQICKLSMAAIFTFDGILSAVVRG
ncbi:unnamed protein product [Mytilus edulis]|uniref:C-type lectin domain-containing protein n=1 Tax=Mytilus edulis TaxID=6550 RepID=A0A8S3STY5_MYTED|nr:unnamed protein product [Mytilus edulis]